MTKLVALPETPKLVKDLIELLSVLNQTTHLVDRRTQAYTDVIPPRQLEERARAVAQYLYALEVGFVDSRLASGGPSA